MRPSRLRLSLTLRRGALIGLLGWAGASHANPADFVFLPYGDEGQRMAQYAFGVEKLRDGSSELAHSLALGFSPTARWFTAGYAGWYREPGEAFGLYALSWVNHLNLVPQGDSPAELGFYLEIERPRDRSEGYGLTWGPTLQFDLPRVQINLNLWLQKDVRNAAAEPTALVYQWQAKSLWRPGWELGLQGFGTVGPWLHWSASNEQEHMFGPAVFAKWAMGEGRTLNLDAAALVGISSASPRGTFRLRTQYLF